MVNRTNIGMVELLLEVYSSYGYLSFLTFVYMVLKLEVTWRLAKKIRKIILECYGYVKEMSVRREH